MTCTFLIGHGLDKQVVFEDNVGKAQMISSDQLSKSYFPPLKYRIKISYTDPYMHEIILYS